MRSRFINSCKKHGFHCKGAAAFRVIGDGVLQVLKYQVRRTSTNPMILVGLFSMYGEVESQWLTFGGCIPRYEFYQLFSESEQTPDMILNGLSIEEQLIILDKLGFSWLDAIQNQAELVKAICELDIAAYHEILWNDMLKFAPFLRIGDLNNAAKIIRTLLQLHMDASGLTESNAAVSEEVEELYRQLSMVKEGNAQIIQNYLFQNYSHNLKQVHFCTKR